MIVFLLLVIIAILLLGASRFIGVVGAILGFIALVLAVFFLLHWIASSFGIDTADMIMYVCFAIVPIAVFAGLARAAGPRPPPTVSPNEVRQRMAEALEEAERRRLAGKE